MSLAYPAGGATAALGVVGLCKICLVPTFRGSVANYHLTDLLFHGEGETFNVRLLSLRT